MPQTTSQWLPGRPKFQCAPAREIAHERWAVRCPKERGCVRLRRHHGDELLTIRCRFAAVVSWSPWNFALNFRVLRRCGHLLGRVLHQVVPSRTLDSVLIGVVVYDGMLAAKIIEGRRRRNGPLKGRAFPGIHRSRISLEAAV